MTVNELSRDRSLTRLLEGRHDDPASLLGRHGQGADAAVCALLPHARCAELISNGGSWAMQRQGDTALFRAGAAACGSSDYQIRWTDDAGCSETVEDPYRFAPSIAAEDLRRFSSEVHEHLYRVLGAHLMTLDGISGVRFATWAPNAERVSVVGDFNRWHGLSHPLQSRGASGVWELFVPGVEPWCNYKFEIRDRRGVIHLKTDPFGNLFEYRPATASRVAPPSAHAWQDDSWLAARAEGDWQHMPVSIYELHAGSWRRHSDGGFLNYRELALQLADYVSELGFTHVELLPITEHPLDDSWGYQTTGYFAPSSRFGTPDDFRFFVDHMHSRGIGVILDWVPAHFPRDAHGLSRFDGTAVYEHEDSRLSEHPHWGTLVFNYGRNEVRNFLLASANYWLEEFHVDGLRVDAVASMLYLDYGRAPGKWLPNVQGGNENLEAIQFLQALNSLTHGRHPGTLTFAEESTDWPLVTRPTWLGGLGFSVKWNMGWMHDTLSYLAMEPIYRHYHHDQLTFGIMYAFSENFLLPLSHDEVVHEKRSLLKKMPGDAWQRRANLRLLLSYQYAYPGCKLLFMGCEFGMPAEWSHKGQLPWELLADSGHGGIHALVRDLNHLYTGTPCLHRHGFEAEGFEWIDCHDATQSVLSFLRRDGAEFHIVVLNFTPVVRQDYRIGVPRGGNYEEVLNSDSRFYGGSDVGNGGTVAATPSPWMDRAWSISLTLPPLAALVLRPLTST